MQVISLIEGLMKRFFAIFVFASFFVFLGASIRVEYQGEGTSEQLQTIQISSVDYYNVYELNKVFGSLIEEKIVDNNLELVINNRKIIFLLNSSYAVLEEDFFNFTYPLVLHKGKYYLPTTTLSIILPKIQENYSYSPEEKLIVTNLKLSNKIRRIVIDPGHGGKDPGARGSKSYEKNIALTISKELKKRVEKELGLEVLLTRDTDEFISLKKRTQIANAFNADFFISVHINASVKKSMHGVEVYFLSTKNISDDRANEVMHFENSVVERFEGFEAKKEYDDLSFILSDMMQNEFLMASQELAEELQKDLTKGTSFKDRGVRQAGFYVLKGAFMPSVLVELGFITNKKQESQLLSKEYQKKIVNSLIKGISTFKVNYEKI